jgi:hypothetical protein
MGATWPENDILDTASIHRFSCMLKVLVRSEELVIFLPASASPLVVKAEK